jgi:DNA primase
MPRIPDEEIQRLKREVSLVRLCQRYNIELKPQGKNFVGFCPWHKDDKPSFIVTPEKNLWHCMGACDEGGDVFNLVQKIKNVSFRRAADILLEISGSLPASQIIKTHTGTTHQILINPENDLPDTDLKNHVTDFYHRSFLNDPKAMQYLEKRNCMHPEAVNLFAIGYANRTLGYRVPATTAAGKRLKARLQEISILRKSGHEHMSGSVVFPIMDLNNNPVQMYGRKITAGLRKGTPEHLYLEQPMKGVFNLKGIANQKEWILCECIIDALTLWCHGLRNVTCCFGKNTFTDDMWTVLRRIRPTKVIIAFDNDESGNKAAEKLAPKLAKEGANVLRLKVPQGKDINEYVGLLAGKDKKAIPGILSGLFMDAPVICQADPENVDIAVSEPVNAETETSTSISFLAANKENPPEHPVDPGQNEVHSFFMAADLAAKEKNTEDNAAKSDQIEAHIDTPAKPNPLADNVRTIKKGQDIEMTIGNPAIGGAGRSYRIRGLAKNQTFDVMKINLRVMADNWYHVDNLDLYNARHRTMFINTAADELQLKADILKKDLGKVLLNLEDLQDEQINKTLAPKKQEIKLTEKEREQALELLKDPSLFDRINADFARCGYVGEENNRLIGYLAATSRMLEEPLAIIVQSATAAGKTALMKAILNFMPKENRVQYSAVTGQSLFYMTETNLKHKILAIVEEEGAENAGYALKLLQSEGELTIASTGRDANGEFVTKEYHVEGPVMVFLTTTSIEIDEELLNRCIVLVVDEDRAQTQAIHNQQRMNETLSGQFMKTDRQDIIKLHQNAQRLLKPIIIANNFAPRLTFPDHCTRTRRDHMKYLVLIRTSAFIHQYQRPIKTAMKDNRLRQYIEVTLDDVALANRLANDILGRSLDELPPQTRKLLLLIDEMVIEACKKLSTDRCDYRFTRRMIREYTGWGNTQLKAHLKRLEDMEYLLTYRGGRGQQFV